MQACSPYTLKQLVVMGKVTIFVTGIYKLDYCDWKTHTPLVKTWIKFKIHFYTAYTRIQEYQCTTTQDNFQGANNMTSNFLNYTSASQNELQKFLAKIAAEHLKPPTQSTVKSQALELQVTAMESQLATWQEYFNSQTTNVHH